MILKDRNRQLFIPLLQMKAYKQYEKERRPLDRLSDEDRFMLQVCTKNNIQLCQLIGVGI